LRFLFVFGELYGLPVLFSMPGMQKLFYVRRASPQAILCFE